MEPCGEVPQHTGKSSGEIDRKCGRLQIIPYALVRRSMYLLQPHRPGLRSDF